MVLSFGSFTIGKTALSPQILPWPEFRLSAGTPELSRLWSASLALIHRVTVERTAITVENASIGAGPPPFA